MLLQLAAAFNVEELSLFSVTSAFGSALALALLGFLLACWAYRLDMTYKARAYVFIIANSRLRPSPFIVFLG